MRFSSRIVVGCLVVCAISVCPLVGGDLKVPIHINPFPYVYGDVEYLEGERLFVVGNQANGTMEIYVGNRGGYPNITVGRLGTATGTVTVQGFDAGFLADERFIVGDSGIGFLSVESGAEVSSVDAFLGFAPSGTGEVIVQDADSLFSSSYLYVGFEGEGKLEVLNGGQVEAELTYIGNKPGSVGELTVQDPNSEFTGSNLDVGYEGSGTLSVLSDGQVTTDGTAYVGYREGSLGAVVVGGGDAQWSVQGDLEVGYSGSGEIEVSNGLLTSENGILGRMSAGMGRVEISAQNGVWDIGKVLTVGDAGTGELDISSGGKVSSINATIGNEIGSTGVVRLFNLKLSSWIPEEPPAPPPVTEWKNADILTVGGSGSGSLSIGATGTVTSKSTWVGQNPTGVGLVTVSTEDSQLSNEYLSVGIEGEGTVSVSGGGRADAKDVVVGYVPGGVGLVEIKDVGSSLTVEDALVVGLGGEGSLFVSDAGQVTADRMGVGYGERTLRPIAAPFGGTTWLSSFPFYPIGKRIALTQAPGLVEVRDNAILNARLLNIWTYGTLRGDGTIVSEDMRVYGRVQPGNSIGTMTVDGNLTFEADSVLEVEVDNSGNSDRLDVTGDVVINGGTVQAISTETLTGTQSYTLIDAAGVTGTFSVLDTALLDVSIVGSRNLETPIDLNYSPTQVGLTVSAIPFDDPELALQGNRQRLASTLQKIASQGGNDMTASLQQLGTRSQLKTAYEQLGGETRPSLGPITTVGSTHLLGAVTGRIQSIRGAFSRHLGDSPLLAMATPSQEYTMQRYDVEPVTPTMSAGRGGQVLRGQDWGAWAKGYGVFGDRDADSNARGYDYRVTGTGFGLDYQLTDRWTCGVTVGLAETKVDYLASPDSSRIDGSSQGLYGSYTGDGWYGDAILSYADLDYHTDRFVSLGSQHLTGDFKGYELTGYLETGINLRRSRGWVVQPLASLQVSFLELDPYTETGGVSALGYGWQDYTTLQGALGAKLTKMIRLSDLYNASLQFRGRWIHEFGDAESHVNAYFTSQPSATFDVMDESAARDSIVFGTSLYTPISRSGKLLLDFDTRVNSDEKAHYISGACQFRW